MGALRLTILGCGSSGGVPRVGYGWGACDPQEARNRRRRCSLLVERQDGDPAGAATTLLVDTSPDLREQLLGTAERKLEEGVDTLKQGEDKAEGGGSQRAEAERAALKNIVTMYETMKPKDAARVFDRLSLDVLVPIVLAMNPRKMAEVLALMQSEPAEKLTVALANRARGQAGGPAATVAAGLGPNELPAIDAPTPPPRR